MVGGAAECVKKVRFFEKKASPRGEGLGATAPEAFSTVCPAADLMVGGWVVLCAGGLRFASWESAAVQKSAIKSPAA